MKLGNQLLAMVAAAVGALLVPVAALTVLSSEVSRVHASSVEAQTELSTKLALISATESYFRAEMDRIEADRGAGDAPTPQTEVLGYFDHIQQLIQSNGSAQGARAEVASELGLKRKYLGLAHDLSALEQGRTEEIAKVDRRYDTELLPALFESAGHESRTLAASMVDLDRRSTRASWAAFGSLLVGLAFLAGLMRFIGGRTQSALAELVAATRALAKGAPDTRVRALAIDEFDEIGRAFNTMAAAVKDAADARVRVEKLAAVGQLAASVGHEIRNPLSAARNALAFLRKKHESSGARGDRVAEFIALADRELGACNRIVQDLLDFARERPLCVSSCALQPLVAEVLEVVRGRPGVALENAVSTSLPPIDADRDQLRQILLNLVQNGVEAIQENREGSVSVRAEVTGGSVRISVADDGMGIPEADRSRIFEPLVTTKTKGTGLGLAITSSIVKRHGGAIELETVTGKGTSFHISLPLQPHAPPP